MIEGRRLPGLVLSSRTNTSARIGGKVTESPLSCGCPIRSAGSVRGREILPICWAS